jgi:hypothetical protein
VKIIFYIFSKGRRILKFTTANELVQFIKNHNLPKDANIILKEDDVVVGKILVTRFLEFENDNRDYNS